MNRRKGNSFANGESIGGGQSTHNGPYAQERRDGWDPRPASIWNHMEPGLPA